MSEDLMNKLLMIAGLVLSVIAGIATVSLVIVCALNFTWSLLFCSILLGIATAAFGGVANFYGHKVTGHPLVFTNEAEREVLNTRQRRELRRARGEVVMERAMIEVEHERQNIVHKQLQSANDPDKPPYDTQWSDADQKKPLSPPRDY
jgi:hypothetical protein